MKLTENEKKMLQLGCARLLHKLHQLNLAHLDFTPENVLYGANGLKLCDFAKATPIWSNRLRHLQVWKEIHVVVDLFVCRDLMVLYSRSSHASRLLERERICHQNVGLYIGIWK